MGPSMAQRRMLCVTAPAENHSLPVLGVRPGPDRGHLDGPRAVQHRRSTRCCLAIAMVRRLRLDDVLYGLTDLLVEQGPAGQIRSDNGPQFADPPSRPERLDIGSAGLARGRCSLSAQSVGGRLSRELQLDARGQVAQPSDLNRAL
jgi:hypothetical protein